MEFSKSINFFVIVFSKSQNLILFLSILQILKMNKNLSCRYCRSCIAIYQLTSRNCNTQKFSSNLTYKAESAHLAVLAISFVSQKKWMIKGNCYRLWGNVQKSASIINLSLVFYLRSHSRLHLHTHTTLSHSRRLILLIIYRSEILLTMGRVSFFFFDCKDEHMEEKIKNFIFKSIEWERFKAIFYHQQRITNSFKHTP